MCEHTKFKSVLARRCSVRSHRTEKCTSDEGTATQRRSDAEYDGGISEWVANGARCAVPESRVEWWVGGEVREE